MNANARSTRAVLAAAERVLSQCVGARLRTLNRVVTRMYDDQLRSLGIRFSQLNILMLITGRGPMSASDIGATLALEKSTLSRNLRVLESQGWVRRHANPVGGVVKLEATAAGCAMVIEAEPLWRAGQDAASELLGERGSDAVRAAFGRIERRMDSR